MKFRFIFIVVLAAFLSPSSLHADQSFSMEAQAAYQYLNQVRTRAGMIPLKWNQVLAKSAASHAGYLEKNKLISHLEKPGLSGFSGVTPGERAIAQGYEIRKVIENYSSGRKDSMESIDGLMSAIYHRFGFLDFSIDEVGIALSKNGDSINFVYNMGNELLNRYCRFAIDTKETPYYEGICSRSERVSSVRVDRIENQTAMKNPGYVIWPVEGQKEVPTVFYEEIPDPLPGLSVSGYPVSIQLNPALYASARIKTFKLFRITKSGDIEIKATHLLTRRSDPNRKLTPLQFALFPLKRLDWGTEYQVRLNLVADDKVIEKTWTFVTQRVPYPMFVISAAGDALDVRRNATYAVYLPPTNQYPFIEKLEMESPYRVQVDVSWEDRNTVLLKLSGQKCQPVHFYLNGNRYFSMRLSSSDNLNPDHTYPTEFDAKCK